MGLLFGALAGAGEGAMRAGAEMQRTFDAESLMRMTKEADAALATRLEEMRQGHAERMQKAGFEHAEGMQQRGFEHAEGMQLNQQEFQQVENELNRAQQSSESALNRASQERIAKLGRDTQMAIANMHGTVQVGQDGKILWVGPGGKVTDTGFTSIKDLSPTQKAALDIIKSQQTALEREALQPGADQAQIGARRTQLAGQTLAIMSGDVGAAFSAPKVEPTAAAIEALRKNPDKAADFKAKYGVDPQQYLNGNGAGGEAGGRGLMQSPMDALEEGDVNPVGYDTPPEPEPNEPEKRRRALAAREAAREEERRRKNFQPL